MPKFNLTNKSKALLFSLLGLNFLFRALVALRPLKYIDGLTIPDDAYLSLTLARNIAKGLGPLYGDSYTNGFQPLYVFLIAPIFRLFPHDLFTPIHLALLFLAALDTVTLYIIYRAVKETSLATLTPFIAMAAWILNPYAIATANNGMETSLSLLLIALAYYFYIRFIREKARPVVPLAWFVFGVILGLAMLARIDNVLLAACFTLAILYSDHRIGSGLKRSLGHLVAIGAGALFACLPWMIYIYHYAGDLIPISGRAIRNISGFYPTIFDKYLEMLEFGVGSIAYRNLPYLILFILLIAVVFLLKGKKGIRDIISSLRPHNTVLVFVVSLFLAYVFYVFGTWYFKRYFFPTAFLLLLYIAALVDLVFQHLTSDRKKAWFAGAIVTFLIAAAALNPNFRNLYFSKDTTELGYMNLGLWAQESFPDSTVVGSCQTGALGYFAQNLKVVNLDGVVNKACFEHLMRNEGLDYMKSEKIEYFIDWESNYDFIKRQSRNFQTDDLVMISKIDRFLSWKHEWYIYKVKPAKVASNPITDKKERP